MAVSVQYVCLFVMAVILHATKIFFCASAQCSMAEA